MALKDKITCVECGRDYGKQRFDGTNWRCVPHCISGVQNRDQSKDLFGFETMNMARDANGGPVQVKSLRHLRQLEREHGVHSVAFNQNEGSWGR